ncbi:hypothetical protein [Pseudoxanthomonas sp.]|uniref:hypothetical protein n=1 Tax=Pseudoxanthomonas sp. TaxID=1871049 RepID=UPI00258AEB09|nr:hypothetical protein [Pseudoxanthomonas sp.]MCR6685193.1 hypothetical protein [Pseudoxanthomonas sp.]
MSARLAGKTTFVAGATTGTVRPAHACSSAGARTDCLDPTRSDNATAILDDGGRPQVQHD